MENGLSPRFLSLWREERCVTVRQLFTPNDILEIAKQYLETALWESGNTVDAYSVEYESRFRAASDALDFLSLVSSPDLRILAEMENTDIGHDLWLNRTGAGEGFWSRGLGAVGDRLSDTAHSMEETYLEIGDDGVTRLL